MKNQVEYETRDGRMFKKTETVDGKQITPEKKPQDGAQAAHKAQPEFKKSEGKKDE